MQAPEGFGNARRREPGDVEASAADALERERKRRCASSGRASDGKQCVQSRRRDLAEKRQRDMNVGERRSPALTVASDLLGELRQRSAGAGVRPEGEEQAHAGSLSCRAPDQSQEGRSVAALRSEEHTSELQSRLHLVCRLLLEKK